jgi:hypothetical protein
VHPYVKERKDESNAEYFITSKYPRRACPSRINLHKRSSCAQLRDIASSSDPPTRARKHEVLACIDILRMAYSWTEQFSGRLLFHDLNPGTSQNSTPCNFCIRTELEVNKQKSEQKYGTELCSSPDGQTKQYHFSCFRSSSPDGQTNVQTEV